MASTLTGYIPFCKAKYVVHYINHLFAFTFCILFVLDSFAAKLRFPVHIAVVEVFYMDSS